MKHSNNRSSSTIIDYNLLLWITIHPGCDIVTHLYQAHYTKYITRNKFVASFYTVVRELTTYASFHNGWGLYWHDFGVWTIFVHLEGRRGKEMCGWCYVLTQDDFCVTGFDWSLHFKWIPLSSKQRAEHRDPTESFLWVIHVAAIPLTLLHDQVTHTHAHTHHWTQVLTLHQAT